MTARYAISCATCVTSAPLFGDTLSMLSTQVTAFMQVHDHVNRNFAVIAVPARATSPVVVTSAA